MSDDSTAPVEQEEQDNSSEKAVETEVSAWVAKDNTFQPRTYAALMRANQNFNEYRVYRSENEEDFETVTAETAIGAIRESGIEEPFKVVLSNYKLNDIFEEDALEFSTDLKVNTYIPLVPEGMTPRVNLGNSLGNETRILTRKVMKVDSDFNETLNTFQPDTDENTGLEEDNIKTPEEILPSEENIPTNEKDTNDDMLRT